MNDILRITAAEPVLQNFKKVQVASYGHSIYWGEEGNEKVELGCDRLRELAEEQAALLAHVG